LECFEQIRNPAPNSPIKLGDLGVFAGACYSHQSIALNDQPGILERMRQNKENLAGTSAELQKKEEELSRVEAGLKDYRTKLKGTLSVQQRLDNLEKTHNQQNAKFEEQATKIKEQDKTIEQQNKTIEGLRTSLANVSKILQNQSPTLQALHHRAVLDEARDTIIDRYIFTLA